MPLEDAGITPVSIRCASSTQKSPRCRVISAKGTTLTRSVSLNNPYDSPAPFLELKGLQRALQRIHKPEKGNVNFWRTALNKRIPSEGHGDGSIARPGNPQGTAYSWTTIQLRRWNRAAARHLFRKTL